MSDAIIMKFDGRIIYIGDDYEIENVEIDGKVAQICVMGERCRLFNGGRYEAPTYPLSHFAPNDDIKAKWNEVDEEQPRYGGFRYNGIYMMKMSCGHYEVFQHSVRNLDELREWVILMHSKKHYRKCTMCICDV